MKQWEADDSVPGLGLMALPSGTKTWYLRYREQSGKQRTQKLGRAAVINKTIARREALKILSEVAQGRPPLEAREKARQALTVAELLPMLQKRHYKLLRPSSVDGYERMWNLHVIPKIGQMKITAVQRSDVLGVLDPLPVVLRNRLLRCLKAAFNKAELWQLRPEHTNPCSKIPTLAERKRKRYLTDAERDRLLVALDAMSTTPLRWRFAQMVRLLLLTGCRVGEICRGRWEWIDQDAAVMVIPVERHKTGQQTGEERVVHIPPAAVHILSELRLASHSDWIIAGDGDSHLVGYQKLWLELLRAAKIQNLRVHDLRHHFASVAITKAGLTLSQVGSLLGHVSPSTTKRYAHLIDEGAQRMVADVAGKLGL